MTIKRGFKKGEVTNPNGRGKGTKNKSSEKFIDLKKKAAEDYGKAYKWLIKHMEVGEGWAFQIFFRQLVPKKKFEECIRVEVPEYLSSDTVDGYLRRFIEALRNYKEYTVDEWLQVVSVLNRIKFTEKLESAGVAALHICNQEELDQIESIFRNAEDRAMKEGSLKKPLA